MRRAASALGLVLAAVFAAEAHAEGARDPVRERPFDAPLPPPGATARPPPEVTPEYTSIEEQGMRLVFHLRSRERAPAILSRALAARAELSRRLGREVLATVEIRLAAAPLQLPALSPPELPPGAHEAAFSAQHLVVLSLGSPAEDDLSNVMPRVRHGLAHLALDEATGQNDAPRWFQEGFAIDVAGADVMSRAGTLTAAALGERLIGARQIPWRFADGEPGSGPSLAAAQAAELVRHVEAQPVPWASLLASMRRGESFDRALKAAYDGDLEQIDGGYQRDLARRFAFVPVLGVTTLMWVVFGVAMLIWRRRSRAEVDAPHVAPPLRSFGVRTRVIGLHATARSEASRVLADGAAFTDDGAPGSPVLKTEPAIGSFFDEDGDAPEDDLPPPIEASMPPNADADVPKVEHDGRWYTLH